MIAIANWKMNKTVREARDFVDFFKKETKGFLSKVDVVICPPFTAISSLKDLTSNFSLGAQDLHWENSGAWTGEVSGEMLADVGCEYVLIGHSERRWKINENDAMINKKLSASLKSDLIPVLCVGEKKEDREKGRAEEVIQKQLGEAFREIGDNDLNELIVAYEPAWAIGTGEVKSKEAATPEIISEAFECIEEILRRGNFLEKSKIIYGGSVDSENLSQFLKIEKNSGFLIGGASLIASEFVNMIKKLAIL
ncbi:MAG: hypothetical protein ACD_63C00023G0007 [uncultured bacterium]|nr:MAG: hypothetical protein ACD_63C00023G0007 [uncultured bacterium]